jgi:hypothetical protein
VNNHIRVDVLCSNLIDTAAEGVNKHSNLRRVYIACTSRRLCQPGRICLLSDEARSVAFDISEPTHAKVRQETEEQSDTAFYVDMALL